MLAAAIGVLASINAASASAATFHFPGSGETVKFAGTLTWKMKYKPLPVKCTITGSYKAANIMFPQLTGPCENGWTAYTPRSVQAYSSGPGAYYVELMPFAGQQSPFGEMFGVRAKATWANGTALTPSTITFNETLVGNDFLTAGPVTVSGSLQVATASGGLVTIE